MRPLHFAERWPVLGNRRPQPDRVKALEHYARLAARYEKATTAIRDVRRRLVELLDPQPGETVFDVACGAGAMLVDLAARVGPSGQVIGIEQSPQMVALARAASVGNGSIRVLESAVEECVAPRRADALLFCYTHDVLQNPQALARLFAQVRPGARVAVGGLCLLPWWGLPVDAWVMWRARCYLSTWHGLRRPWAPLLDYCPDLQIVRRFHVGTGYLAKGTHRHLN
jgi:SAM-dependent methyltransferase